MTCLVTGCALVLRSEHGPHLWGDMHSVAPGCLIFNAVLDHQTGDAMRVHKLLDQRVRTYFVSEFSEVFERRGILVLDANDVGWNAALGEYLGLRELERRV